MLLDSKFCSPYLLIIASVPSSLYRERHMCVRKKFFIGVYLALVLPDKDLEIYMVKLRGNNFDFLSREFHLHLDSI